MTASKPVRVTACRCRIKGQAVSHRGQNAFKLCMRAHKSRPLQGGTVGREEGSCLFGSYLGQGDVEDEGQGVIDLGHIT